MTGLLIAGGIAMLVSLIGTRVVIEWLTRRRLAQPLLIQDGGRAPEHGHKAGTPTMGGVAIVASALVGYLVAHIRPGIIFTNTGIFVVLAIVAAAVVGLTDDWVKVSNRRNLGLSKRGKTIGLLLVAAAFAVLVVSQTGVSTMLSFTRSDQIPLDLGKVGWVVVTVLVINASSNAVNITDGLDGLVAGSASLGFAALTIIAFWAFRNPDIYAIAHAYDLAVIAVSMLGACAGFLWWNAAPAKIFMGDTGALAIGTAFGALAMVLNVTLLLPIIGALYVAETASVIMQFTSYRYFGKRRIFRMAPIHHHFELAGWPETTVIIRFWILSGIATGLGLGIFYADWLSTAERIRR